MKTLYQTDDGKIFESKLEAETHEGKFKNVKAFKITYNYDWNEGRGYHSNGYVLVHTKNHHKMFVEDWCFRKFGNRIGFVMGAYGSNAVAYKWLIESCELQDVEEDKILAKLEEKFVDKIWSDDND